MSMPEPGWYPDPSGAPRQLYFDGTRWREPQGAYEQPRRGNAIRTIAVACGVVVIGLLSPWLIVKGGYNLWAQYTGTPARVELEGTPGFRNCKDAEIFDLPGAFGSGSGRKSGSVSYNCAAVWRTDEGVEKTVTVYGLTPPIPRSSVDARIHG